MNIKNKRKNIYKNRKALESYTFHMLNFKGYQLQNPTKAANIIKYIPYDYKEQEKESKEILE